MKRTPLIAALLAGTVALSAAAALAHDRGGPREGRGGPGFGAGPGMEQLFERFDADGDGTITEAELQAEAARRFAETDANGDGRLSADELAAAAEQRRAARMSDRSQQMIERLDTDGDGSLSLDEMSAGRGDRMFDRLDADGDGAITRAEAEDVRDHGPRRGFGGRGHHRH